jgi:hypothetical protein
LLHRRGDHGAQTDERGPLELTARDDEPASDRVLAGRDEWAAANQGRRSLSEFS